jgi:hypothetical protein
MHNRYAMTKQAYLKQLLDSAETDDQKQQLKLITDCIKALYKQFQTDFRLLQKVYLIFIRDFFQYTSKMVKLVPTQ